MKLIKWETSPQRTKTRTKWKAFLEDCKRNHGLDEDAVKERLMAAHYEIINNPLGAIEHIARQANIMKGAK